MHFLVRTIFVTGAVLLAACGVEQDSLANDTAPDSSSEVGVIQAATHTCWQPSIVVGDMVAGGNCFRATDAFNDARLVCAGAGKIMGPHDWGRNPGHTCDALAGEVNWIRYTCCDPE
ncbi:hypothetical protein GCM10012319_31890 [Comamonas sp. KCTC 72670]|nr:hypothetical protein GCM10012319_31890 [Comamonas sp. KCTC 72670]